MIGFYVKLLTLSVLFSVLLVTLLHTLMNPEGKEDEFILDD